MSESYFIGNSAKQEYLKCPFDPQLRFPWILSKRECVQSLLAFKLFNTWQGDSIYWYNESDGPPWGNNKSWKDITLETLDEYNKVLYDEDDPKDTWNILLHTEELKRCIVCKACSVKKE
jgi:hypothetical protein